MTDEEKLTLIQKYEELSEEEVMNSFNKIIEEVEKTGAKLRNK